VTHFIKLTSGLDGRQIVVNVDAIAMLREPISYEAKGNTVIVFTDGQTHAVKETVAEIEARMSVNA
jgi:uncharacterized protein YlzI (FlbEa/FlbD family)